MSIEWGPGPKALAEPGAAPRRPLLLHIFPSFVVGGAQLRFCAVANRFGADWRHAILALDGDTSCRERLRRDLLVDYLAVPTHKGDMLGNVRRYRGVLRDFAPDVLVTHNWGSIEWAMAGRLAGLRHVHIEDGFGPEEQDRQLPRRVWTRRLVLRRATVVLPSRTLERIALRIWRLPRRRVRYIPNGIDLTRFAPHTFDLPTIGPPTIGPPTIGPPTIGTVAALRPEKNLARLLRAFAIARRSQPARLTIVGNGGELAALQTLAGSLGIADSVHFTGHLPDPSAAYRGFDIFALASDTEQMPLALLEAMAAGLPVAATAVGDVAAMLADANRRFAVARDDLALAGALTALLADPALRAALGAANRARAEAEYDQERMFRAYADLLVGPLPIDPAS